MANNYGLNSRLWSARLEKGDWSPWLLRPTAVSSLLNQRFLCIPVRREELLASPYRGPSNKPHKSGNLTIFWIGEEEFIACHWCSDLSHWQAGRPWSAGLEKRMFFDTGLDAATATSLLTYMHSRFHFHSTSVLLPEYWLYKRSVLLVHWLCSLKYTNKLLLQLNGIFSRFLSIALNRYTHTSCWKLSVSACGGHR